MSNKDLKIIIDKFVKAQHTAIEELSIYYATLEGKKLADVQDVLRAEAVISPYMFYSEYKWKYDKVSKKMIAVKKHSNNHWWNKIGFKV